MRKSIGLLATTGLLALSAAPAQAAPIRECGDVHSGVDARNLTTRNVSCSDARSFVHRVFAQGPLPDHSRWVRLPGWRPYYAQVRLDYRRLEVDLRATRGNRVIRFQAPIGYTFDC